MSKRQQAVQFSTVAKVLLVSLFLGGSGVGYVLQKGQIRDLKAQKDGNEQAIDQLVNEQRRLNAVLNGATTSPRINAYLLRHRVEMQQPDLRKIVTVPEPQFSSRNSKMSLVGQ
jgi:cell division protein FtsL